MNEIVTNLAGLGICIPTFNRAMILKENLINIIKNVGDYKIPIYISDNCSTDNTADVVDEIKRVYPYIVYARNDSNLGVDRNFEIVLKLCREPYAWLLGDDDTIDADIKPILDILADELPEILVLGVHESIKEGIYTDKLWLLYEMSQQMTWMSGDIISTQLIQEFDFKRYYDTHFGHMGAILDYAGRFNGIRIMYIYNKFVRCMRPDYVDYNDIGFEIYAKGWTELLMRLPGYSYEEKLSQCEYRTKKSGMLNNKILLSARSQGNYDTEKLKEYRNYIKLYNKSPYFVLYFISKFPIGLSGLMRKLYKSYRRINNSRRK